MTVVGIILILIGISALTGISIGSFIVAVILIAIGIRMIVGRSWGGPGSWQWHHHDHNHNHPREGSTPSGEMSIDEVAIFSPLNKSFDTAHFKGGKIVMVFSGGEVDLSSIKADDTEVDLEISSIFSSIEITIPKDWKVRSSANVFLGNVDTHQAQGGDGSVTLTIHGDAVFGEIEVRK